MNIEADHTMQEELKAASAGQQEVRCAVRFPLLLPVVLEIDDSEVVAETRNISASGVLFAVSCHLEPGTQIRFALRMLGQLLGVAKDVLVECTGRVVRCSLSQNKYLAAVTIDDYKFRGQ